MHPTAGAVPCVLPTCGRAIAQLARLFDWRKPLTRRTPTQPSSRRLGKLVCTAGHPRLTFDVAAALLAAALIARPAAAASVLVTSTSDLVNGDTSNIANLIANPGPDGISLREALLAANNTPGANTIGFLSALAGTIVLNSRFAPITNDGLTVTGVVGSDGQPYITIDASQASNPGAILFVAASNFSMSGLRFSPIPGNFNAIQIGGGGFDLTGHPVDSPARISGFHITGNTFSNGQENNFAIFLPASQTNETIANVTIAGNTFDLIGEAINLQGGGGAASTGNVIEEVIVFGNSFSRMTANAGVELGNTTGSNNQIRRTQIVRNNFSSSEQGVYLNSNASAQSSVIDGILIARNTFTGVTDPAVGVGSAGIGNNAITNVQIVDNVINQNSVGQQSGGMFIAGDQQANNTVSGLTIANNTFAGPFAYGAISVAAGGGVSGLTAINNIFYGNQVQGMVPAQVSYSIINQAGFSGINNNINADPLFVSSGTGNFHLQSGSPALHAGTSNGAPAFDLDCQPRSAPPSIGAYEFNGPDICPANLAASLTAARDFNGDGVSDILFRNTGGGIATWLMGPSATIQSAVGVGSADPSVWTVIGQRDINGDGNADIILRAADGSIGAWLMNANGTIMSANGLGNPTTNWTIVGAGDFNGDGIGDILWYHMSGAVGIWYMNSSGGLLSAVGVGTLPLQWSIAGTGDFDGDGVWDMLWYHTSGAVAVWLMNSNSTIKSAVGLGSLPVGTWSIAGTGDFDGNGISDILVSANGNAVGIWFMNSSGTISSAVGVGTMAPGWSLAETGDYNGDGKSDILWYHAASGSIGAWLLNGASIASAVGIGSLPPASWSILTANAD